MERGTKHMKKKSVFSLIVLGLVANLAGCQEAIVDSSESVVDSPLETHRLVTYSEEYTLEYKERNPL